MAIPHIDDLVGTIVPLSRDRITTVGREGDLAFADNEHLHRRILAVYWRDGGWWIENVGTWIPVRYSPKGVALSSLLEVGRAVRLSGRETAVVFRAGRTEYEIAVRIPELGPTERTVLPPPVGVETVGPESLNDDQTLMLLALCEPMLKNPGVGIDRIASMKDVELRLGWTPSKLRRKLDYLCEKLSAAGIGGLISDDGVPASNRRIVLCEWAMSTRVITAAGLTLLP
ncbi:hypothetical protein SAMN04488550_4405 [Gordonia malaquae]|uniref:FHA domain-containing protein n=1 Tax=Gordonia malaquae NBRC 108250 TaxID=1223542 RepID=M3UYK3_GORML|nr:hypothetical protein [Gordonia malaquae]GAC80957.1 hypothetical protein GM1_025_00030 [Gordonia malaquae NBRC 108250]SEE37284.1 hypothetical protein SAMN04488550_4405 [Gordonia malaquae]